LSAGVRFTRLAFPADLLTFLLDLLAFIFFTEASRGTPHILIRIMLSGDNKSD
jgi:hypothetical protein